MKQVWKNTGAPFTRSNGETVGRHETFEAPASAWDVVMRRKKLEPMAPDTEITAGRDPLDGVAFGSGAARKLAEDEGLTATDFDEREGTGQDGAFRADDVREIVEERRG